MFVGGILDPILPPSSMAATKPNLLTPGVTSRLKNHPKVLLCDDFQNLWFYY
jgi:hypothetical protein